MTLVGTRIRRREDPALLAGRSQFIADLAADTLAVAFVRSPVARGAIVGIEAPDSVQVFTSEDLLEVDPIQPILHRPDYVSIPQPILADGRVSYVGEPIAAVLAASRSEAEDAADQVFVDLDYEEPSLGLSASTSGSSTHIGTDSNVVVDAHLEQGDIEGKFADAHEVVDIRIRSRRQSAMPLEARGAVARFDQSDGRITLFASTQMPHLLRTTIADLIHMPESDLRVVAPAVGGGFGQKMALPPEYVMVVWLARHLGASVSWVEDRRENFTSSFHSRDQEYLIRAAFDSDASLTALDAELASDVGAYSCHPVTWGVEPLMAMGELPGPYDVQTYRVRSIGVTTNTCPMSPYRGVSRPVLTLAMERLMDVAARRFDLDPLEIRRRNLVRTFPYTSATGVSFDEGSYVESMEIAADIVDVQEFRRRQRAYLDEGRMIGIGFSVFSERTGYGTPAFAVRGMEITPGYEIVDLGMDPSGNVEVRIGASPHGQGLATSLSQLVADGLGIEPELVKVIHGDTDRTPYGWGTFASRSMVICGGATLLATESMAARLKSIAGSVMEANPADIVLEHGRARVAGTDEDVAISEIARIAHHQTQRLEPGIEPGLHTRGSYDPAGTFSNACHVAEVEVDLETGHVRINRFVVVEDAGLLINPMIVDGQIAGGVTQGIANALFEEIVYDETGNILTTSLLDYLPPTASEVPPIEIHHLETITDASLTGAKGVGEGGTIGAPAAVLNAISDALQPLGIEMFEMPATPQRVRAAIRRAQEERDD